MPRSAKSQWEFAELFPAAETRQVLSVSELTTQVKRLLEKQIGSVWVTGEISNLRLQPSGHAYFTLKDAGAQLSCVLFRGEAAANRDALAEGRKVNLRGDVTVYEARGQYQLRVMEVEPVGIGALQAAFEKLKQKLNAEGLFATERKRPLPRFPERIGIVTSTAAAALQDVLHVIERRHRGLEIFLAPSRVQGDGAAAEIAEAIRMLNDFSANSGGKLDLILVTRGGGSLEDLWAFNEEAVARAIFESVLPVVSAVGHEIDFTIADFVADVRAATPSAAAEIITEGFFSSRGFVGESLAWLFRRVRQRVEEDRESLDALRSRLARVHPRRSLEEQAQRLDELHVSLLRGARSQLRASQSAWQLVRQRLLHLRPARQLKQHRERLASLNARLRLLSPENVLARGYSITMDAKTGEPIRNARKVKAGQRLRTKLQVGEVLSLTETVNTQVKR
ncbi:MAG: exodeoxyribonuclease VII large subunit [Verrucomicrobia bacterium]|nr:exodeoxyribonuclease VII large subunit [Verrucomicrobiota bacterium]